MTDEDLIAKYKADLVGEAEVARADLEEIEDHLRTLADELREGGMPRIDAVREACTRLGDPRAVAREHARVRSVFGARLSRARTISAVALLLPILVHEATLLFPYAGAASLYGAEVMLGALLTLALALRLSWARPAMLGGAACFVVQYLVVFSISSDVTTAMLLCLTGFAGVAAFVAPWRRSELSTGGIAIALHVWAFAAATFAIAFNVGHGHPFSAELAFYAAILATIGCVTRARWAAVASAGVALLLAYSVVELMPIAEGFGFRIVGVVTTGVIAATIGTLLSWRNARSTFGTFQHVLS